MAILARTTPLSRNDPGKPGGRLSPRLRYALLIGCGAACAVAEIRRRERVIHSFPNRDSVLRLLGALLMEIDEARSTGHRYLDMNDYHQWRREETDATMNARAHHVA